MESKSNQLPTISIVTGTLNSNLTIFKQVLDSIKIQNYPKKLIEHYVMDGGSINGTVELAKSYGCKVIIRKDLMRKEQERPCLGMQMAKGKLILILESDNILLSSHWLQDMVKPFIENKDVFCTYSAYNDYKKDMPLTTKYCALLGSTDPVLYYLNKSEKIPMIEKKYNKGKIIKETNKYSVVKFNKYNLPTLGDNGHMFLREAMLKVIKDPNRYTHTDAFMDMFDLGYDTFGVVKNSIIHIINPDIWTLLSRRVEVKQAFYDGRRGKRKYLVYNPQSSRDRINLLKCIIFSLTFIYPLFEAIKGYIKIREKAWFFHPVICFLMVVVYGYSEIKWLIKKRFQLL